METMRRKLVDAEASNDQLEEVLKEWKKKEKRFNALETAHHGEQSRLKKALLNVTKEKDELAHQNSLLSLRLNKSVAEGNITMDGDMPAMSVFEKETIEAAAAAKARRDCDDKWTEKVRFFEFWLI